MFDPECDAKRPFPTGLDVMASFGNGYAEKLLYGSGEDKKWINFTYSINRMKNKFSQYSHWNDALYNKYMESLMCLQKTDKSYPVFMQTDQWNKKNLNTALASWAELKHDVCLYTRHIRAAECAGGAEEHVYPCYVEPNVNFWKKSIELIDYTSAMMKKYYFYSENIKANTDQLRKMASFLLKISEKELNHKEVTVEEFTELDHIGASYEYYTNYLAESNRQYDEYPRIIDPDKSLAVVTDIFTRNIPNCNKNGVLHVANGLANVIYVVVEINGFLYITKGSVLNYYEFNTGKNRLDDEEWQQILEKRNIPLNPDWMDEIILPDKKIKHQEKHFYSSGC